MSIKAEWQDTPLALRYFSRSNMELLLASVTISLNSHPHLHQLVLPILSCPVKFISSSQLFFLLRNSLMRFQIESFQCVYLLNNVFFNIWRVAGIRKRFWVIFSISLLINFVSLLTRLLIKFSVHLSIKQYFLLKMTPLDSKVFFFSHDL